jgi:hypothetical protein
LAKLLARCDRIDGPDTSEGDRHVRHGANMNFEQDFLERPVDGQDPFLL